MGLLLTSNMISCPALSSALTRKTPRSLMSGPSTGTPTNARVAIITGAGQGIGRAIALRLAADGFDIGLNDLPTQLDSLTTLSKEIEGMGTGRRVCVVTGDVSKEEDVSAMVEGVVRVLGGLDVMVANAGFGSMTSIIDCSVDFWDSVMAVNARGTFLCYKHAARQLIRQGSERGGRIIGASSIFGKRGGKNVSPYSAAKFAIRGLTQSAADELGKYSITVNAYAPGFVVTEATLNVGAPELKRGEFLEQVKKDSVVGFNALPEDIANLVSYLASDEAGFVTGQTISINGGVFFD